MIEAAFVFDVDGMLICWHQPPACTGGSIPDSAKLWNVLWENRNNLGGVAHSHPGRGATGPSHTDLTTFAAVERGLNRRLLWPIMTLTHVNYFTYDHHVKDYEEIYKVDFQHKQYWMRHIMELRLRSQEGGFRNG